MLQGLPAARKSTAVKIGTNVLKAAGYTRFASDRMSRQTLLDEMHRINQPEAMGYTEEEMWDLPLDQNQPHEMTIHAREFIDFIGQNDKDYLMLLTNLYDNLPEYSNPKLSSKSVLVKKPTLNFLGASTAENLNMAFPTSAMDTGTLSRILFIHANPSKHKILIPPRPNIAYMTQVLVMLEQIKAKVKGEFTIESDAYETLEYIYENTKPLEDPRFAYYSGRRLGHLLKLCMIQAASRLSMDISQADVLTANTILAVAEFSMPKALGHFGRSKQSTTMHSILEYLETQDKPITVKHLYKTFVSDFSKESDFMQIIVDMTNSKKVEVVSLGDGVPAGLIVPVRTLPLWIQPLIVPEILTQQERETVGV